VVDDDVVIDGVAVLVVILVDVTVDADADVRVVLVVVVAVVVDVVVADVDALVVLEGLAGVSDDSACRFDKNPVSCSLSSSSSSRRSVIPSVPIVSAST
jgi:hypothetical protein